LISPASRGVTSDPAREWLRERTVVDASAPEALETISTELCCGRATIEAAAAVRRVVTVEATSSV
jgi:hypothetical protein